jgi:hypothetical protein
MRLQNCQRYTGGAKRYKSLSIVFITDFSFLSLSFLTTLEGFAIGAGAECGGKSKY